MQLSLKIYHWVCIVMFTGMLLLLGIVVYTNLSTPYIDVASTVLSFSVFLIFIVKSLIGIIFIKKLKKGGTVKHGQKVFFYFIFILVCLLTLLLSIGIAYTYFRSRDPFEAIAFIFFFLLLAGSVYCLLFDIPLIKKINSNKEIEFDVELIGSGS